MHYLIFLLVQHLDRAPMHATSCSESSKNNWWTWHEHLAKRRRIMIMRYILWYQCLREYCKSKGQWWKLGQPLTRLPIRKSTSHTTYKIERVLSFFIQRSRYQWLTNFVKAYGFTEETFGLAYYDLPSEKAPLHPKLGGQFLKFLGESSHMSLSTLYLTTCVSFG